MGSHVDQDDATQAGRDSHLPSRQRAAPIDHQIGVGQDVLDSISAAMDGVSPGGWQPPIIEPSGAVTPTPAPDPQVPAQLGPPDHATRQDDDAGPAADDAPPGPPDRSSTGLPTRRARPAPIAHQIKVGQDLLDAVSASINAVQLTAWQPPIVEAAPLVKPLVKPKPPRARFKTANATGALASSHLAGKDRPDLNHRGSMAPLRPVEGPWRGAVNEVFDWSAEIWGTPKYLPVIRDVGEIRSVMEEPRFDLWARPGSDPHDPAAVPIRVGGSSSESAVLNLATRRAAESRTRLRVAYILLAVAGFTGAHHLYLNRVLHFLLYLAVLLMAVTAHGTGVGWPVFLPVLLLMVVDAILMPRHEQNSTGSLWGI